MIAEPEAAPESPEIDEGVEEPEDQSPTPSISEEMRVAIRDAVTDALLAREKAIAKADSQDAGPTELDQAKTLLKTLYAARVDSLGTLDAVIDATVALQPHKAPSTKANPVPKKTKADSQSQETPTGPRKWAWS